MGSFVLPRWTRSPRPPASGSLPLFAGVKSDRAPREAALFRAGFALSERTRVCFPPPS